MSKNGKRQEGLDNESLVLSYLRERGEDIHKNLEIKRNRSATVVAANNALFKEQLSSSLEKMLNKRYFVGKTYKPRKKEKTNRIVNVSLSDLHYGAALDPREVPLPYGPVEEARRTAAVAQQVAEFKMQYRDETELYIHLKGDIIQNQLHDARDGEPLAHQAAAAMHYLTQFVVFQASKFKKVTVWCTPGNHGRFTSRHKERATNQKWDSIENTIYYAIKIATRHVPNVTVNIPYTPYYTYEAFGMHGFMTHGDTVLKVGFPSSSIDVKGARKQINEINAKRGEEHKYKLFGAGHVHSASWVKLPGNIYLMTNGCLIPTDAYAQSIGITDTACCQNVWETVPGRMVGDRREADVNEHTDKDKSLDKIIEPFFGF